MDSAWEAIFMLLVLKIPVVYLAIVVWWAIRAEPVEAGGTGADEAPVPSRPCGWDDWKRRQRTASRRGRPRHPVGRHPRRAALGRA